MKQLCILMPVYEARERVKVNIDAIIDTCEKHLIDIYLCDSSSDDSIESLVKEYGSENLIYMDKREKPRKKLIEAFKALEYEYEYIWLQSDGRIVFINKLLSECRQYFFRHFDIIHFGNYLSDYERETRSEHIEYTDANLFYTNDVWYMTCFGASIISSRLLKCVKWDDVFDKYSSSFFFVMGIFEACSKYNFTAVHISGDWYHDNPLRMAAGSIRRGDAISTYGKNWTEDNLALPEIYDNNKKTAIMSLDKNTHFFGPKCMLKWRIYDNFTLKKVREYSSFIPQFTTTPVWMFYCIACIPKIILKTAWKIIGSKPM